MKKKTIYLLLTALVIAGCASSGPSQEEYRAMQERLNQLERQQRQQSSPQSTPQTTLAQQTQTPRVYLVGGTMGPNADAVYWLNGQRTVLPKTGQRASANAIAVSGSNVYIAGWDGAGIWNNDDSADAVYWLNGRRTTLPRTGSIATAIAIAVSGSNVYIAGRDGNDAVYWLNGQRFVLPNYGTNNFISPVPRAIAVSGSNVYIAGRYGDDAVYWLNGQLTVLPRGDAAVWVSAIAIIP